MDQKLCFETAMLAGEIALCSGSEIFRVEDTMSRILSLTGTDQVDVYATTTGIIATLKCTDGTPLTGVKRIAARSNNLNRIYLVNEVSRAVCAGKISMEEAYDRLCGIREQKEYKAAILNVCLVLAVMGFTTIFGGNRYDFIFAGVTGLILVGMDLLLSKVIYSDFMKDLVKTMCIAFTAGVIGNFVPMVHSEVVIISTIMPLVPGIPITNAIRDTLQGDYMSGLARVAESLVMAVGIAIGAGVGLGLFTLIENSILV
ncbi:MAG: threonine/serine exporter family protein [Lachnospiraceae bacterium]|nr:threonine/serine exporter family protein [Lachnospiraceae bacterium]